MMKRGAKEKFFSLRTALAILFFFAACLPISIKKYLNITSFIDVVNCIGLAYSFLLEIEGKYYCKKKWLILHGFLIWMIVSSVLAGSSLYSAIKNVCPLFIASVMAIHLLQKNFRKGILTISVIFSGMVLANLLTFFMGGLYQANAYNKAYFMGIRVNISDILIFAVAISLIGANQGKRIHKIICAVCILSGVLFAVLEWVSTALATMGIFALVCLLIKMTYKWPKQKRIIRIGGILLIIGIVSFTFNPNVQRYSWLIEDILGESLTLDGRTDIWESCINQIKGMNWIYGHGFDHGYTFAISNGAYVTHPHNQYLAILFNFGLIGLLMYCRMLMNQFTAFIRTGNKAMRMLSVSCTVASIVMGISMTYFSKPYWLVWHIICISIPLNDELEIVR